MAEQRLSKSEQLKLDAILNPKKKKRVNKKMKKTKEMLNRENKNKKKVRKQKLSKLKQLREKALQEIKSSSTMTESQRLALLNKYLEEKHASFKNIFLNPPKDLSAHTETIGRKPPIIQPPSRVRSVPVLPILPSLPIALPIRIPRTTPPPLPTGIPIRPAPPITPINLPTVKVNSALNIKRTIRKRNDEIDKFEKKLVEGTPTSSQKSRWRKGIIEKKEQILDLEKKLKEFEQADIKDVDIEKRIAELPSLPVQRPTSDTPPPARKSLLEDLIRERTLRPTPIKTSTKETMLDKIRQSVGEKILSRRQAIDPEEQFGEGNGLDGLYESQIDKAMNKHKNFIGTISCDEINTLPLQDKVGFVMNLDKAKGQQKLFHWVAVWIDADKDKSVEYYDSLGNPPTEQFKRDIKKYVEDLGTDDMLKFKINTVKGQRDDTDTCGAMAMNFLEKRMNGVSFKDATGYGLKNPTEKLEKQAENINEKHGFGFI